MGFYTRKLPPAAYLHFAITQMKQDFGLPDIFYLDLWPFGPCLLLLTSPDAAAIPTTANNFPMPDVVTNSFDGNVGTTFIEATNGPLWKYLMHQLAPGLNSTAVKTFSNSIIDYARALYDRLEQCAEIAQPVEIQHDAGALINPLTNWRWKQEMNECLWRLEGEIQARVNARHAELQEQQDKAANTRAPTLLDRMLLPRVQSQLPLDSSHMKLILESAKGFIIAGYGTTTATSTYIWMLLSTHLEVLRKLREEHDRVFDSDFERTFELLQENPSLIKSLHYTTTVIHETLRLFPIGMTARQAPPNLTMLEHKGVKYLLLKNHLLGIMTQLIHYDPEVFEDPKRFRPDRFLDGDQSVPRNAYRPFERGVRACIGQALAMDELKISLLMLARWFEFELVDHEPAKEPLFAHTDLDTKLGKHAFQVHAFTAMPGGSVKMMIRLARLPK
uniref:Cytochrome P450 n=1 Tax=Bionectria ochroleuca TaxID=29856 RepID=A0A8H7N168_BIOOC